MSTHEGFESVKRKVFLAYHQDGVLDISAAMVLLGFGTFMATGNAIFLVLGPVFATQYILWKQYITIPRFGYVRFEPVAKSLRQGWLLLGLGVLALLVMVALSLVRRDVSGSLGMQAWLQRYHMVPYSALFFGLPFLLAAAFLGLKRFYLYALLVVGLSALAAWMNMETFLPILATGFVLLAVGLGLLFIFVKSHSPVGGE